MAHIYSHLARALKDETWPQTARPNQLPPPGDWSIWLLLAGRGFGKTRAAAEWVRSQVEAGDCPRDGGGHATFVSRGRAGFGDFTFLEPADIRAEQAENYVA